MRSRIAWAILALVVVLVVMALIRFNLTALQQPGRFETLVANRTETEASATATAPPASVTVASATPRDLAPCKTPIAASPAAASAPPPRAPESHQRKRDQRCRRDRGQCHFSQWSFRRISLEEWCGL